MTNIFVANLPYSITEAHVRDCFEQFGAVEKVQIIMDRVTGWSRGFAFIEMTNDDEAAAAIANLHGRDWDGRTIHVRLAVERNARNPPSVGVRQVG